MQREVGTYLATGSETAVQLCQRTQEMKMPSTLLEVANDVSLLNKGSKSVPREVLKAITEWLEECCGLWFGSETLVFPSSGENDTVRSYYYESKIGAVIEWYRYALLQEPTLGAKVKIDDNMYFAVELGDSTPMNKDDSIVQLTRVSCLESGSKSQAVLYSSLSNKAQNALDSPKEINLRNTLLVSLYNHVQNILSGPYYDFWLQRSGLANLLLNPSKTMDVATLCQQLENNLHQYETNVTVCFSNRVLKTVHEYVKSCGVRLLPLQELNLNTTLNALAVQY